MKIVYDQISSDYRYPLSKKEVRSVLTQTPETIRMRIKQIRFGCNTKTTQEAKLTQRGKFYDMRINFCLNNSRSLLLSDDKKYIKQIESFRGEIDFTERHILWNPQHAKRYAYFLIFHEIGHIFYCDKYLDGKLSSKGTNKEEDWCDNFSINSLKKIRKNIGDDPNF